ncbi:MAG: acetylglutamate kinase [Anaerolineae bacterium]|nr:acetylglutamate kinase [Anaerolineae bacterium]
MTRSSTSTHTSPIVLKIGGNDIDSPDFLSALAGYVATLDRPVVIVHGGGKEIGRLQAAMGIEAQWVDGLRVTDEATLSVVEMVLCGSVNKRLVRRLVAAGIDAAGLSGTDRALLRGVKLTNDKGDLGRVGAITQVRADVLNAMLAQGITPVIAPLALGDDGEPYNVNADHAAAAIAKAVGATQIVFLTNVSAVLVDGQPQPAISAQQAHSLIADGTIYGGMIPKVKTALHAVELGIPQAVITDLPGLQASAGTIFHADQPAPAPAYIPAAAAHYAAL